MNFKSFLLSTFFLILLIFSLQAQDSLKTTELNEVQVHLFEKNEANSIAQMPLRHWKEKY